MQIAMKKKITKTILIVLAYIICTGCSDVPVGRDEEERDEQSRVDDDPQHPVPLVRRRNPGGHLDYPLSGGCVGGCGLPGRFSR